MPQNYYTVNFSAREQAAQNGAHGFITPVGMTLVGISMWLTAAGGAPTNTNIDVQVDGSDVITGAITLTPAGAPKGDSWLSTHFGGSAAPIHIDAGEDVEIDLNFSGGSTPDATYDLVLTFLAGTV